MPKATVNKYDFPPRRKDQIRATWRWAAVQPIAVSETMDDSADGYLQAGVLGMDGRHVKRSSCPIEMVHRSMFSAKFLHKPFEHGSLFVLSGTPDLR
jgi:hypothetical protein